MGVKFIWGEVKELNGDAGPRRDLSVFVWRFLGGDVDLIITR